MTRKLRSQIGFVSFFVGAILTLGAATASAQNVSPFGSVGNVQLLDGNGAVCPNCVLYSFQAGTTTQQATYTDATGLTLNPNPIPFNGSGRAAIWLLNAQFYKFVLCLQNDGPTCTAGDTQFVVDQVPGSPSSQQQGNAFTGTFTSPTANAASSGILRLASGDQICWRNAANSGNLCLSKDSTDILAWPSSLKCTEGGAPSGQTGFDIWWCDSGTHRMKHTDNNATAAQFVNSGVDINTSDQVIQLHWAATATPVGAIAPTPGQVVGWNGANLIGVTPLATPPTCIQAGFSLTYNPPTWACVAVIPPVFKKGTAAGNYSTASAVFSNVDGANLAYTITIPTGSNLVVHVDGVWIADTAGSSTAFFAIADAGIQVQQVSLQDTSGTPSQNGFSLTWVIAGDNFSHAITLQFKQGGGSASTAKLQNVAGSVPTMLFTMQ